MPWAVAATGLGIAGNIYASNQAEDAAADAAARTTAASAEQQEIIERARNNALERLQPYADQEGMARNQMMAQLGLIRYAPQPQSVGMGAPTQVTGTSGGTMGNIPGIVTPGGVSSQTQFQGGFGDEGIGLNDDFNRFLENVMADQIAIAQRAGYSDRNNKAATEGARRVEHLFQRLKNDNLLPDSYQIPSLNELIDYAVDMKSQGIDFKNYGLNDAGRGQAGTGEESYDYLKRRLEEAGGVASILPEPTIEEPMAQPQPVGQPEMLPTPTPTPAAPTPVPQMGQPTPAPEPIAAPTAPEPPGVPAPIDATQMSGLDRGEAPTDVENVAAPGVMGGTEAMDLYGATTTPEGFMSRYYRDVEAPGYAEGWDYMMNPAYQAMIEENQRVVNQNAASQGALYSGRRSRAASEMSADTQLEFQRNLQDVRAQDLARRGEETGQQMSREDQYLANFMNMLSSLASPTTATNQANIETGQAASLAQIPGQNAAAVNEANLAGVAANNAMIGDSATALGELLGNSDVRDTVGGWFGP